MRRGMAVTAAAAVVAGMILLMPGTSEASTFTDSVKSSRATVRDAPGRLVLANALPGDRIAVTAYCGDWVRVRVSTGHAMSTPVGWVARGSLDRASRKGGLSGVPKDCAQAETDGGRWRSYVSAMNAPFRSYYRNDAADPQRPWRRVFFSTQVLLASSPDCVPSYNYIRGTNGDRVDPAQRISGLDLSGVGYRYVTRSGDVALVSAHRPGQHAGVWSFVPSSCLQGKNGGPVYFAEVVQFDQLPKGSDGKVLRTLRTADLKPNHCHDGLRSPTHPQFGWWPDPAAGNKPGCGH